MNPFDSFLYNRGVITPFKVDNKTDYVSKLQNENEILPFRVIAPITMFISFFIFLAVAVLICLFHYYHVTSSYSEDSLEIYVNKEKSGNVGPTGPNPKTPGLSTNSQVPTTRKSITLTPKNLDHDKKDSLVFLEDVEENQAVVYSKIQTSFIKKSMDRASSFFRRSTNREEKEDEVIVEHSESVETEVQSDFKDQNEDQALTHHKTFTNKIMPVMKKLSILSTVVGFLILQFVKQVDLTLTTVLVFLFTFAKMSDGPHFRPLRISRQINFQKF